MLDEFLLFWKMLYKRYKRWDHLLPTNLSMNYESVDMLVCSLEIRREQSMVVDWRKISPVFAEAKMVQLDSMYEMIRIGKDDAAQSFSSLTLEVNKNDGMKQRYKYCDCCMARLKNSSCEVCGYEEHVTRHEQKPVKYQRSMQLASHLKTFLDFLDRLFILRRNLHHIKPELLEKIKREVPIGNRFLGIFNANYARSIIQRVCKQQRMATKLKQIVNLVREQVCGVALPAVESAELEMIRSRYMYVHKLFRDKLDRKNSSVIFLSYKIIESLAHEGKLRKNVARFYLDSITIPKSSAKNMIVAWKQVCSELKLPFLEQLPEPPMMVSPLKSLFYVRDTLK